jgi:CcmD family protein
MGYLVAAYTVIWTLLFIFLLLTHRRQQRVQSELEAILEKIKSEAEGADPGSGTSRTNLQ